MNEMIYFYSVSYHRKLKLKPIYVETHIDATMDDVWQYTQVPAIHGEWDLRFNTIEYLPKDSEDAPQHFLYETTIGFGITVSGKGESGGERNTENGERVSALKFWSDEKISLIKTGSGYWKYIPTERGVTFLTWYDYETRWGVAGKVVDKLFFRPLIGWATAWSFDALKNWLEKGTHARVSKMCFYLYALANFVIALTWLYHGIIPKLMHMETGELAMMRGAGIAAIKGSEAIAVYAVGVGEVLFGIAFLFFGRWKALHYLNIIGLLALATCAACIRPDIYLYPFNPATTSFGVIGLSLVVLRIRKYVPDAGNCRRKPRKQ